MRTRPAVLLACAVLAGALFAGAAAGLTAWGGPSADDPDVVAERRAALAALDRDADALLAAAGLPLLDRSRSEDCVRGSRAVGGLGVDTGYRLRCSATVALQTSGGPLTTWADDVLALHGRLTAAGWTPGEHALPDLVDDVRTPGRLHGGRDGRPGPADAAAAVYRRADGTELSVVLAEPGERPAGPTPFDDVMGFSTLDRLPAGGYGVVLRLAATTFSA